MQLRNRYADRMYGFSALQRAENSSIGEYPDTGGEWLRFSALQRAENSSIVSTYKGVRGVFPVSVLFSEPKIPQFIASYREFISRKEFQCSSASRKFLNVDELRRAMGFPAFQCSSASRKFLNPCQARRRAGMGAGFSALQRAENSSMLRGACWLSLMWSFSALQRAENSSMRWALPAALVQLGFSALQRAENSSIRPSWTVQASIRYVSVLFSEPKIPQCRPRRAWMNHKRVSVLFSEPKIPQCERLALCGVALR